MWFMGRVSTKALAAVGAVQWLVFVAVLVLGGAGTAVQTLVAQYYGARRYRRAGQAVWIALWAMACATPLFVLVGAARHLILAPFGFDPEVERLASAFWFPRVGAASVAAAVWALFGFFNGIGRPRVTLLITVLTTGANALLNQLFIFRLGWGIAGSAWATNAAQLLGLLAAVAIFLRSDYRRRYRSHLTWRAHWRVLARQLRLGVPMGLSPAADLLGFAIFQMMQTRLGTPGGAATQIVVMLTSLAYLPGFGIASAGTTLVGQAIGADAREWALRIGNRVILLAALYMSAIGILIALGGPWVLPFFTGSHDAEARAAVAVGLQLLWLAAGYQFFDGLNLGSSMCLRGAGDVRIPALLVLPVSLLLFVPLAHAFTFAPGDGWVHFLPQFGWGAVGGWVAVLIYVMVLGSTLYLRWRSRAWQAIRI
jgi:MATE family multidrug resistance protein